MDMLALADFNLVAMHGSFSEASRKTGRPKATLSRRVLDLEESLGARLVERNSRGFRLTEAGALLRARTGPLLDELVVAGKIVSALPEIPRGCLRVSAPSLLSDMALGSVAASFARTYPEVRLEIVAEDRMADPIADGYDLVIRVNPSPNDHLVGRCVVQDERWLVAAPSIPRPTEASGKATEVAAIVRTAPKPGTIWTIRDGEQTRRFQPQAVMSLSSLRMLRDAVLAGGGSALLPKSLIRRDVAAGKLALWGVEDGSRTELWALHTSSRLASAKVTAFIQHLVVSLHGLGEDVSANDRQPTA